MLDTDTKRRIDSARDILVGKVPDPKSQVEQITLALIYKFMDDMDAEAEELGGERTFFAGEFARYGWAKMMDVSLGAQETLNRYAEALEKMKENQKVPQLFRDIFKNAFLPYRDPETLKSFLKVINGFEYDHSERLGDAFEYLLNVLGTQADAGQFRTPRHIIDFMVELVDPKKEDRVLDPACGTAGFLISAYKHIVKQNRENEKQGAGMTPDERTRLMENFEGYDISPDMVRLSLVNLYLHGFTTPKIFEYDTLTNEERWKDYADVILANPPFMSPKGGIRPHKRFSVESNRSEVLFVDYIMEHLTPNGRAAVIVPEGVIFQGGTAYKALRKMLVEQDYLVGVISLPAGVFNPYSGVKTSILWIDRTLAKKADSILFCKIEGDGFDLGAQRRPNGKNDLPKALALMKDYQNCQLTNQTTDSVMKKLSNFVHKAKLSEIGDYNLVVERYVKKDELTTTYKRVLLGEITRIAKGKSITKKEVIDGPYPVIAGGQSPAYFHNEFNYSGGTITASASGAYSGFINYFENPIFVSDSSAIQELDKSQVNLKFIYHILKYKQLDIYKLQMGMGQPHVYPKDLARIEIPLPSLEVQQEIVAEIEGYQKIIDGARMVVENYRPWIEVDPSWPVVKLGEVCEIVRGASPRPINKYFTDDPDGVNWIKIGDAEVGSKYITGTKQKITKEGAKNSRKVEPGDFILSNSMSFGRPYIVGIDGYVHDGWLILRKFPKHLLKDYLFYILSSDDVVLQFKKAATGGVVNNLNSALVRLVEIPIPPIKNQEEIIRTMEIEEKHVQGNKDLIAIFEEKIQARLAKVWGE